MQCHLLKHRIATDLGGLYVKVSDIVNLLIAEGYLVSDKIERAVLPEHADSVAFELLIKIKQLDQCYPLK